MLDDEFKARRRRGGLKGAGSVIVGNPNRKKMHIFGFVGIFEYIC